MYNNSSVPSDVFVVLINGRSIHSIFNNRVEAETEAAHVRNSSVHKFPLIANAVDSEHGMTEADDKEFDDFMVSLDKPTDNQPPARQQSNRPPQHAHNDLADLDLKSGDEDEHQPTSAGINDNDADVICLDIPLMIRLFEFAREDASGDADLHRIAENMVAIGTELDEVLTMDHYDEIVDVESSGDTTHDKSENRQQDYRRDNNSDNDADLLGPDEDDDIESNLDRTFSKKTHHESMYEAKIPTLADFIRPTKREGGDAEIPTISSIFTTKKQPIIAKYTRAKLVQDPVTTAFKIDTNITDKL